MASPLRLSLAGRASNALIAEAWATTRSVFEAAEAAMSRFREDSELTRLNRLAPEPAIVSRRLAIALSAADRARRLTDGRFDPRVVDALERIGYQGVAQSADRFAATTGAASGPAAAIARAEPGLAARPHGPTERIYWRDGRGRRVSVATPVDLGGIGKGLALRWAGDALDRLVAADPGCCGYLLDAGGDIAAAGRRDGREPWLVGIEDPWGSTEPLAVVGVPDRGGIATSSTRRLRWIHDGQTVHHLIDPRTGRPGGDGIVAVTVAGFDPAWAEVWSKALFLEGRAGIAALARGRGLAAWWVTADGGLQMTPAARPRTVWVRGER